MNLNDEVKIAIGVSGKLTKIDEDGTIEFYGRAEGLHNNDYLTWIAHKDMVTHINGESIRKVAGKENIQEKGEN